MRRRFCQSKSRFLRVSIAQDAARQPHSLCRGDHRIGDAAFIAVGAGLANLSRLRKGAAGRRRKSGQPQFFALRPFLLLAKRHRPTRVHRQDAGQSRFVPWGD
jgi:hypothetical protein